MVTFTSSGNSGANPTSIGVELMSFGIKLTNSLTPDLTGLTAETLTLNMKADSGGSGSGTYKGFVQTAAGVTTFTDIIAFSYPAAASSYDAITFTLPTESIEDDGIVGILIITTGIAIAIECWDTTDQSGNYVPMRGNTVPVLSSIRTGATTTVVTASAPSSSNITFPQIPEPKNIINSAFNS